MKQIIITPNKIVLIFDGQEKELSKLEFKNMVNDGIVIDVRELQEREKSKLKTSLHFPLSQIEDMWNKIPEDKNVFVHCISGKRSLDACEFLDANGRDNIYVLIGNFEQIKTLLED